MSHLVRGLSLVLLSAVFVISVGAADAGGTISGAVTTSEGKVAAEFQIQIFPANMPTGRTRKPEPTATGKTDANGNYSLANVPPGAYRMVAGQPFTEMAIVNVTVKAGQVIKLNVKLKPRVDK